MSLVALSLLLSSGVEPIMFPTLEKTEEKSIKYQRTIERDSMLVINHEAAHQKASSNTENNLIVSNINSPEDYSMPKTNLLKIVDPLQKLLDQRAALDAQIAEMKKMLIAAIESEEAPVKAPKVTAGKKPKVVKTKEPKARGRKPKKEQAEEV